MSTLPAPFGALTVREKIGQTCQIHGKEIGGLDPRGLADYFARRPVGSLFLGSEVIGSASGGHEALRAFIGECQTASRLSLSIAGDLENGAGGAIRGLTTFPHLLALGALDDPRAAYEYGRWTAVEACRIGFNWTFGPVVDLCLNWLNPVVNIRSLGQFPERVAELAAALIRGCQEHGLSATAKHFPGDGVDFRDQHLCVSVNALSREEWRRTFGQVYESCFASGVHAVMAGHVALPWLDRAAGTGGTPLPATTSRPILHRLLREEMGYDGVVVSDALIMAGFRGRAEAREDLIVEAFNAGIDVMLWPGADYFEIMERALERGRISEQRLDQSVERILTMKARQGLDVRLSPATVPAARPVALLSGPDPAAAKFSEAVAERSLTLVENRRGLLPLDPHRTRRLQVLLATPVETNAEKRLEPLLQSLRERGIETAFQVNGNCLDLRHKEEAGERFDALLVLFELGIHGLKNTMRPTGAMAEVLWTVQGLETVQPIIVSCGSPYLLYDTPWAETYINAHSYGPSTYRAIVRALFGEIPFAGVSPVDLQVSWTSSDGRSPLPPAIPAPSPQAAVPGIELAGLPR